MGKPYGKPWVNTQGFPPEETPEEKWGENPGEKWGGGRAPLFSPLGKNRGKAPPPVFPPGENPEEKWGGGDPEDFPRVFPRGKTLGRRWKL